MALGRRLGTEGRGPPPNTAGAESKREERRKELAPVHPRPHLRRRPHASAAIAPCPRRRGAASLEEREEWKRKER